MHGSAWHLRGSQRYSGNLSVPLPLWTIPRHHRPCNDNLAPASDSRDSDISDIPERRKRTRGRHGRRQTRIESMTGSPCRTGRSRPARHRNRYERKTSHGCSEKVKRFKTLTYALPTGKGVIPLFVRRDQTEVAPVFEGTGNDRLRDSKSMPSEPFTGSAPRVFDEGCETAESAVLSGRVLVHDGPNVHMQPARLHIISGSTDLQKKHQAPPFKPQTPRRPVNVRTGYDARTDNDVFRASTVPASASALVSHAPAPVAQAQQPALQLDAQKKDEEVRQIQAIHKRIDDVTNILLRYAKELLNDTVQPRGSQNVQNQELHATSPSVRMRRRPSNAVAASRTNMSETSSASGCTSSLAEAIAHLGLAALADHPTEEQQCVVADTIKPFLHLHPMIRELYRFCKSSEYYHSDYRRNTGTGPQLVSPKEELPTTSENLSFSKPRPHTAHWTPAFRRRTLTATANPTPALASKQRGKSVPFISPRDVMPCLRYRTASTGLRHVTPVQGHRYTQLYPERLYKRLIAPERMVSGNAAVASDSGPLNIGTIADAEPKHSHVYCSLCCPCTYGRPPICSHHVFCHDAATQYTTPPRKRLDDLPESLLAWERDCMARKDSARRRKALLELDADTRDLEALTKAPPLDRPGVVSTTMSDVSRKAAAAAKASEAAALFLTESPKPLIEKETESGEKTWVPAVLNFVHGTPLNIKVARIRRIIFPLDPSSTYMCALRMTSYEKKEKKLQLTNLEFTDQFLPRKQGTEVVSRVYQAIWVKYKPGAKFWFSVSRMDDKEETIIGETDSISLDDARIVWPATWRLNSVDTQKKTVAIIEFWIDDKALEGTADFAAAEAYINSMESVQKSTHESPPALKNHSSSSNLARQFAALRFDKTQGVAPSPSESSYNRSGPHALTNDTPDKISQLSSGGYPVSVDHTSTTSSHISSPSGLKQTSLGTSATASKEPASLAVQLPAPPGLPQNTKAPSSIPVGFVKSAPSPKLEGLINPPIPNPPLSVNATQKLKGPAKPTTGKETIVSGPFKCEAATLKPPTPAMVSHLNRPPPPPVLLLKGNAPKSVQVLIPEHQIPSPVPPVSSPQKSMAVKVQGAEPRGSTILERVAAFSKTSGGPPQSLSKSVVAPQGSVIPFNSSRPPLEKPPIPSVPKSLGKKPLQEFPSRGVPGAASLGNALPPKGPVSTPAKEQASEGKKSLEKKVPETSVNAKLTPGAVLLKPAIAPAGPSVQELSKRFTAGDVSGNLSTQEMPKSPPPGAAVILPKKDLFVKKHSASTLPKEQVRANATKEAAVFSLKGKNAPAKPGKPAAVVLSKAKGVPPIDEVALKPSAVKLKQDSKGFSISKNLQVGRSLSNIQQNVTTLPQSTLLKKAKHKQNDLKAKSVVS